MILHFEQMPKEKRKISNDTIEAVKNVLMYWMNPSSGQLEERDEKHAIYSAKVEKEFKISGAEIRGIIQAARRDGIFIKGCHKGYFLAKTHKDKVELIEDLEGRAESLNNTASFLRKALYGKGSLFNS